MRNKKGRKQNVPKLSIKQNIFEIDFKQEVIYIRKVGRDLSQRDKNQLYAWAREYKITKIQRKKYRFSLHAYCYSYEEKELACA